MFRRRKKSAEDPKPVRQAAPAALPEPSRPSPEPPPPEPSAVYEKTNPVEERGAPVKREDFGGAGRSMTGALLGKGSRFKGKLTFEGKVIIDGEFIGDIESEGHLEVGKDARVDGTIQVQSAVISGHVGGNVTTSGELELKSTARVTGDLDVKTLVVERGATFDGTIRMRTAAGPKAPGTMRPAGPGEAPPIVAPPKSN